MEGTANNSNKKDQNDKAAGFSGNADMPRQQSVVSGDLMQMMQDSIIVSIMAAQEKQFNKLETLMRTGIDTTNKRLDSLISDLVIEDEPSPAKKQKLSNEQNKEVVSETLVKADNNAANGSANNDESTKSIEVSQNHDAEQNATSSCLLCLTEN